MGFILYEGPSSLNGDPVVAIVTGEDNQKSANSKTGEMVQVWILPASLDPLEASRQGKDESICGTCVHRGTPRLEATSGWAKARSCYVALQHAPLKIYRGYVNGKYSKPTLDEALEILSGKTIRWGAYGDPVCIPIHIVQACCKVAKGWTGYTHQWHQGFNEFQQFLMASCESPTQRAMANAKGWRTFRVGLEKEAGEIGCPASVEEGKKTNCAQCKLCAGQTRVGAKDIFILPHGGAVGKRIAYTKVV
jgi:hypothetical protein